MLEHAGFAVKPLQKEWPNHIIAIARKDSKLGMNASKQKPQIGY
jgi:hypothetical protein